MTAASFTVQVLVLFVCRWRILLKKNLGFSLLKLFDAMVLILPVIYIFQYF